MLGLKIGALDGRKYFCNDSHKEKLFTIIGEKIKNKLISSMYMKTAVSCFCPYASSGIISAADVDLNRIDDILKKFDFELLEYCN